MADDAETILALAPQDAFRHFSGLPQPKQIELYKKANTNQKRDLLFLAPDPNALISALPMREFLPVIDECTASESDTLFDIIDDEHVNFAVQVDCWHKGKIDDVRFFDWLSRLHDTHPHGDHPIRFLNLGFFAAGLLSCIESVRVSRDLLKLHRDMNRPYPFSPEDIEFNNETAQSAVELLYAFDQNRCEELIRMLAEEDADALHLSATAEFEQLMRAHGAVEISDAWSLLDDSGKQVQSVSHRAPADASPGHSQSLSTQRMRLFIHAALSRTTDVSAKEIGNHYVKLLEEVALVDKSGFGASGLKQAHSKAEILVSIGLEHLCGSNVDAAAKMLGKHTVREMFQAGYALAKEVAEIARVGYELMTQMEHTESDDYDEFSVDLEAVALLSNASCIPPRMKIGETTRFVESKQDLTILKEQIEDMQLRF